jgi:DnaJ like chaperone protein
MFRDFFLKGPWFGKLIGACFGYLTFGSIGALLGILIGNIFDKGLTQHFLRPHWLLFAEKNQAFQTLFFKATFQIMGHLAKAKGRITEEDIAHARHLMNEFRLTKEKAGLAIQYFNDGKQSDFNMTPLLIALRQHTQYKAILLHLFIDIQYRFTFSSGANEKQIQVFNDMLSQLGFRQLHQQYRFYDEFSTQYRQEQAYQRTYRHKHTQQASSPSYLTHAYALLNISSDASKQQVKRAYRQLMSKHHPDKLIAQGLPETMIKMATEKTQAIQKAYESICNAKGW